MIYINNLSLLNILFKKIYVMHTGNILISIDTASRNCFKQSKKFWSYIKSLKKGSTDIPLLKTNNGTVTDNPDKAELLNTQFQSVFTNEDFTVFQSKALALTLQFQILS